MDVEVFIKIEGNPSRDRIRNEVLKELVGTQNMPREKCSIIELEVLNYNDVDMEKYWREQE
jgi:hypothetical protein